MRTWLEKRRAPEPRPGEGIETRGTDKGSLRVRGTETKKRETRKERRLGRSREGVRGDLEQKSQDPDLEIEVLVLSLHRKLALSLT